MSHDMPLNLVVVSAAIRISLILMIRKLAVIRYDEFTDHKP